MTCKKYKGTLSNLASIIQEQNKTIETLQRQHLFQDKLYQKQNNILKRTQEKLLCPNCLYHFRQPNHDFELCKKCSTTLP